MFFSVLRVCHPISSRAISSCFLKSSVLQVCHPISARVISSCFLFSSYSSLSSSSRRSRGQLGHKNQLRAWSSIKDEEGKQTEEESAKEFDVPPWEPPVLTEKALRCIEERQLCHQITPAGGPCRSSCLHGYPQAFVFHPSKRVLNSGLFRLTCPLLVKAVDEYEAAGGIREVNKKLAKSEVMQKEFRRVNARHSAIRRSLATPEQLAPYIKTLGAETVEQIMASGLAGISPHKIEDLKCLHAHLADYLCTNDNDVGKEVYELLSQRGIDVDGSKSPCWQQCDVNFERTEGSWWYTPIKNKQKLRSRYEKRHKRRVEARGSQEEGEGDV